MARQRRSFLKIGGLALGGLSLPQILEAEAKAGIGRSHKAITMIYLPGAPPHQDLETAPETVKALPHSPVPRLSI